MNDAGLESYQIDVKIRKAKAAAGLRHQIGPAHSTRRERKPGALAGQVDVVIDVLHILAIVQHADELLEHGQVFRTNCLAGPREEGDLLGFQLGSRECLQ